MDEERATSLLLLAEQAEGKLKSPDAVAWLDRLEREHEPLLAALSWFLERGDLEKALRLGAALYSFWHTRGYLQEGREWFQKLLATPGGSASVRAKVLHRAGMLAFRTGDQAATRALFEEGLKIAREVGDKRQIVANLLGLGRLVALRQGNHAAGHRLFDEGLAIARELGDRPSEGSAIHCLAALARLEGDQERAVAFYKESLTLHRDLGDERAVAMEQLNLGFMAFHQGDTHSATGLFEDSLRSSYERGDKYIMPPNLVGLAAVAAASGDPSRAARLLGSAGALLESAGLVFDPDDQLEYDRIAGAIRAKLGGDKMNAMLTEGRAMKVEQAIGYATQGVRNGEEAGSSRE